MNIAKGFVFILIIVLVACQPKSTVEPIEQVVNNALDFSLKQSVLMAESLKDKDGRLPQTIDGSGKLVTCGSSWWVSGFFPGQLWYMYEYSNDEALKDWADLYSQRVADQQYTTSNHDVGFMIFCSFGNGYRLTKDSSYLSVIENGAKSLSTRYREIPQVIRSWDYASWSKQWQYPVIIDNMMNLELLMWTAQKQDEPGFMKIAQNHANTTMKNHFRPDYSSYHVVSYDTITGEAMQHHTSQGYSHESAWARGQAWGLYGFVSMYRFTKKPEYLEQAKNIANFIVNHPNLPSDKIPYWDFDAPNIPDAKRDASAGAISCSALIELSDYVDEELSKTYLQVAEQQIRSMSSPAYRNELGANGNFILNHSVGHMPNKSEVDVPLSYADYYYVEALIRYKFLVEN